MQSAAGASLLRRVLTVLLPFGMGYFLSFFYRSLNVVIGPRLERDLELGPEALGLLTAVYFVGFALFQFPLGVLLDRYGPRRVQSTLLTVAAGGAILFALAGRVELLILARALIGIGVSGSLISAFTAIVHSFDRDRLPLVNAVFLVSGGLGALAATGPLEALLGVADWRTLFLFFGMATALVAAAIRLAAPEFPVESAASGTGALLTGMWQVARDPALLRITPLSALCIATFWSFQGLWATPWMADVQGLAQNEIVTHLLAMAISFIAGSLASGLLADWSRRFSIAPQQVMVGGVVVFLLAEIALLLRLDLPTLAVWCVLAFTTNFNSLAFALVPQRLPRAMTGRVLTMMNVITLFTAFAIQYGIGAVLERWPSDAAGQSSHAAYVTALGVLVAAQMVALAFFMWPGSPWRRVPQDAARARPS